LFDHSNEMVASLILGVASALRQYRIAPNTQDAHDYRYYDIPHWVSFSDNYG